MFRKLKSLLITIFAVSFLAFFINFSPARAQAPNTQPGIKVEIKNLTADSQKVTGTLSLNNLASLYYPQLFYTVALVAPSSTRETTYEGKTVTLQNPGGLVASFKKPFELGNSAQTEISFEVPFSNSLPSGDYSVLASVQTSDGSVIGYATGSVNLQTNNSGMLIDPLSCEVIVNQIRYNPSDGPIVSPQDTSEVSCSVKNLSSSGNAQVSYEIDYGVGVLNSNNGQVQKYIHNGSLIFTPAQEKIVSFNIPDVTDPQVYEGYVYMLDGFKNRISPGASFRWIVGGPSASIRSVALDKNSYQKDEVMTATIDLSPSADLYWRGRPLPGMAYSEAAVAERANVGTSLKDATLEVIVTDKAGLECGSKTINLPDTDTSSWSSQSVQISSTRDCSYPQVKAAAKYQGKTLAEINKNIPVLVSADDPLSNPPNRTMLYWILAIILAITIGVGGWFYLKKKRGSKNKPQTPNDKPASAASPLATKVAAFLIGFTVLLLALKSDSAVVFAQETIKPPINNPINSKNINFSRGSFANPDGPGTIYDNFYSNYTNFSQVEASGSSSIVPDPNCAAGAQLKLVGWSGNDYSCQNKTNGIRYIVTIDGQPAQVTGLTSPDSQTTSNSVGSNGFDVWGLPGQAAVNSGLGFAGIRTANFTANLPGGLRAGSHKIDIKVLGLGLTDQRHQRDQQGKEFSSFYTLQYTSQDNLSDLRGLATYPQPNPEKGGQIEDLLDPWVYGNLTNGSPVENCGTKGTCSGLLSYEWTCTPPPVCNESCTTSADCEKGGSTCSECQPDDAGTGKVCRPPAACNVACTRDDQCAGAVKDGCTICSGGTCKAPACNIACVRDDQCTGAKDGCTSCVDNVCKKPPACNDSCTNASDCAKAIDGCTSCEPSDTGTGKVCKPPPACNVACVRDDQCAGAKDGCNICSGGTCKAPACGIACTKDGQCAGAKDGCTVCMGGVCKPPPSCGTACTTKTDCSNPKDGCSECLEGTCTDYNDNMCKCDGIVADLTYPSSAFKFEAFGKVEGSDVKKAEIADITFRFTKDNQVIAKSNPITPEIVENNPGKLRFKAAWQTPPPPVSKNSTYRVFADVRCKPKKIIASADEMFSPNKGAVVAAPVRSMPPKGLELVVNIINRLSGNNNEKIKLITSKVLALFSTSTVQAQGSNLQLQTLNFIKMVDTDNCRFVMFKFDETLF